MKKNFNLTYITLFLIIFFTGLSFGKSQIVRKAAVAGKFYTKDAKKLSNQINNFSIQSEKKNIPDELKSDKVKAAIVPHAGYIYSGIVAASAYNLIKKDYGNFNKYLKVFILAPTHYFGFHGISIPKVDFYQTPLGDVYLSKIARTIRKKYKTFSIPRAHVKEHAIEVQIPFLQETLKKFKIIPIVLGKIDPKKLAKMLIPFIDESSIVLASSDLSHYYFYDVAKKKDKICLDAITSFNFKKMYDCEACGLGPILTLMHIAEAKNWSPLLVDYKNSGDTAGGKAQVVGYTSIVFYKNKNSKNKDIKNKDIKNKEQSKNMSTFTKEDKTALLKLARSVIANKLDKNTKIEMPKEPSKESKEKRGCFVTLHKHGNLRGCIGTIEPVESLIDGIEKNAINAAFKDPRFPALTKDELKDIDIEISVLTVPKVLKFTDGQDLLDKLKSGVHGVILSQGWHSSTFLPQVWEQLPDKKAFLSHLCQKGGMNADCWKSTDTTVKTYEAEYFSEK